MKVFYAKFWKFCFQIFEVISCQKYFQISSFQMSTVQWRLWSAWRKILPPKPFGFHWGAVEQQKPLRHVWTLGAKIRKKRKKRKFFKFLGLEDNQLSQPKCLSRSQRVLRLTYVSMRAYLWCYCDTNLETIGVWLCLYIWTIDSSLLAVKHFLLTI